MYNIENYYVLNCYLAEICKKNDPRPILTLFQEGRLLLQEGPGGGTLC